jgi:lipoyl(octanoyl) transferase
MHGFALNINTDLSYFERIVPCGINEDNKSLTTLALELNKVVQPEEVKAKLLTSIQEVFGAKIMNC